jgi:hypothetical protein
MALSLLAIGWCILAGYLRSQPDPRRPRFCEDLLRRRSRLVDR